MSGDQGSLFDRRFVGNLTVYEPVAEAKLRRTPRAATADPETSHQAAETAESSGLIARQAAQVLAALRETPGFTTAELARYHNLDRYMVARRMADLKHAGLVREGEPRRCTVGRGRAMPCYPTQEAA